MGQTLSRTPTVSDVPLCASLLLGLGGGCGEVERRTDRLLLQAEVHLLAEMVAKSPSSPCFSRLPPSTSRRSRDLLRCPGEGRGICPSSVWWLGGPWWLPRASAVAYESGGTATHWLFHPLSSSKNRLSASVESGSGLSAQDPDRAFTMHTFLLGLATSQKSTEDPLMWLTLDPPSRSHWPPGPPSPSTSRWMR